MMMNSALFSMKLQGLAAMVSSFSSAESPEASACAKRAANIHGYSPYWHHSFGGSPASHFSPRLICPGHDICGLMPAGFCEGG